VVCTQNFSRKFIKIGKFSSRDDRLRGAASGDAKAIVNLSSRIAAAQAAQLSEKDQSALPYRQANAVRP
jgi:hypothetical protein